MKKRVAVLCGTAVALASALTAVPTAQAAPAPAPPRPAWKKCATEDAPRLQCATVRVPLDHAAPDGRKIALALTRVPHTAKKSLGPLLVNPGGPGGSGVGLARVVASGLPASVAARYDVVGFDPRGVGKSRPALNCVPGHSAPVRPDTVPATAALERANLERARAFAAACGKKHRDLLPYIDTVSAAKDLDVIRRALGAQRINYLGYSYGTYLGSVYAKLYPHRVRRMVLDSVVDPTGIWYENNLQQDIAFEDRHRAFMAWVARHDAVYGLGADPARVEAKWYAMRAAVAAKPAQGVVGPAELEDLFLPGGYHNGYWPLLARAFSAYSVKKQPAPLVQAYRAVGAVDAAGDNGYSVYTSVLCRDAPWPREWGRWRADNWAVHEKARFMTWSNAWYNAPCAFWPTQGLRRPLDVTNHKAPPVLIFQATGDAATPYAGAVRTHRLLRGSSLVVEEGGGNHGVTLSGNRCLDRHLAAYLTDGTVPRRPSGDADATCPALPDPKPAQEATRAVVPPHPWPLPRP
ncbi:alpha/beta hydrolase [Streptomyces fragilis]|uniref:Alpha/beta hydrolase n=1 Tax=Streptomyces fragilis TaxID=67301 RepID=A0ABV2YBZ1_9ACTN|nr:alpha/beta hydrolase [Streptomyces fragilis]